MTSSMQGYFKFNLVINDGAQEASVPVKIVIINEKTNRIKLIFNNPTSDIDSKKEDIRKVFNEAFAAKKWTFNIDKTSNVNDINVEKVNDDQTQAKCHFLQENFEPVPIEQALAEYDNVMTNISNGLLALNLTLRPTVSSV